MVYWRPTHCDVSQFSARGAAKSYQKAKIWPYIRHNFCISPRFRLAAAEDTGISEHSPGKERALMEAHQVQCGPFRVDLRNECLWHGAEALHLRPKTFAVLRYFVTHPSRYGQSGR
jgi:hypothetical protein